MKSKKAQLTLGDAPTVVLLVGLVFLVMATIAFIGQKYGNSFPYESTSVINESSFINSSGDPLLGSTKPDARSFSIIRAINGSSGAIIQPANYTVTSGGTLKNSSTSPIVWANVNVTYDYEAHTSAAYNVTGDLQTEISNNTSIAGIVLTISLVGIVLSVLIGVFLAVRRTPT